VSPTAGKEGKMVVVVVVVVSMKMKISRPRTFAIKYRKCSV
jgi:hypothetical protein